MGQPFRILSIDGGGIRGALAAQVMYELEQDLPDGQSLYSTFDLIAGTSTGGLIALYLAAARASGQDLIDLYSPENAREIMDKSFWDRLLPVQTEPKYDGEGKRRVLSRYLGDIRLGDVEKPLIITAYDIILRRIVVFKNTGGSDSVYNPKLAEVGDATSAAPTYFPIVPTDQTPPRWLVDGGLAANNPSMCAIAEALNIPVDLSNIRLLSIGTGVPTRDNHRDQEVGEESRGWGGVEWLNHGLIDHLFAGNTSTCEYQCRALLRDRYVRVTGPLNRGSDDLDDVSAGNIEVLRSLGAEWYEQFEPEVRDLLAD